jgi:TonB family protein
MGRVGLRTVLQLHWCMLFCAALATANIPVALAQTHPPKGVPPTPNSALAPARDLAPPKVSPPENAAEKNSDSASADSPTDPTNLTHASNLPADFVPPDGIPLAGARGVTHPVCLRCPPAQYSYSELLHKVQGNVTLDAIVGTDGWVTSVRILGSLGAGLDEQAMKAVRTWQWEPARDAEGKTVATHQTVVLTFHIPK